MRLPIYWRSYGNLSMIQRLALKIDKIISERHVPWRTPKHVLCRVLHTPCSEKLQKED